MGKTYLMGDIAKELKINKTKVFRSIKELELEAINEKTRKHKNSPKKYSEQSKNLIVANLIKEENRTELQSKVLQEHYIALRNVTVTQEPSNEPIKEDKNQEHYIALQERYSNDSDRIIELLEAQLEAKDKELDRAYQEKQDLIRLLDQQQQLSLKANQKIEILEYKQQENKKDKEVESKKKWWEFFKRDK